MAELENIRHSLAHLLAAAVLKKFPKAKLGVGPVIENGFYYDFLLPRALTPDDSKEFEKTIKDLTSQNLAFKGETISAVQAKKIFKDQPFKLELIKEFAAQKRKLTVYRTSDVFFDLCEGGHVKNTKEIDAAAFQLDKTAGAYWRGNEKNPQLQRIYGLAFNTKKELETYLQMREEAKKRDHRKLGQDLDLFAFSELVGAGLPLYTPKGAIIRRTLNDYIESLQTKAGYEQVWTPQMAKAELFKISDHYSKYKDSMFRVFSNYSEEEFYLKPMNCPQHTQIYASRPRSYRDLPVRYTDFAMLYRDEKPGELNGLARTRGFSQDDCHVFCREDQVDAEIDLMLAMTKEVMKTFGFKYKYRLSTRDKKHPEKYLGDPKTWDKTEKWAEKIMARNNIEYFDGPGEATFYAPKMDLIATDALGREWQLSTVQIDFFIPQRFGLTYVDKDGKKKCPMMLHRAIIGSSERFIMILLEHFAGALPLWLSPVQTRVIAISEKQKDYAEKILRTLKENNIRADLASFEETVGKNIRQGELEKIPYLIVVGEKEAKAGTINVRERQTQKQQEISLVNFLKRLAEEIKERK